MPEHPDKDKDSQSKNPVLKRLRSLLPRPPEKNAAVKRGEEGRKAAIDRGAEGRKAAIKRGEEARKKARKKK